MQQRLNNFKFVIVESFLGFVVNLKGNIKMSDLKEHVKEVEKFEKSSLNRTDTVEKIILPDGGGNSLSNN